MFIYTTKMQTVKTRLWETREQTTWLLQEIERKTGDGTINHETVDTRANHMCVSYLDLIQTKQLKENYDNFLDLQKSEY